MDFMLELFIQASCTRLRSFVHHLVSDVKLDAQEKRFVLTTFSRFIGLCRVILVCMVFMDKKLTEPGPETSVHPSVTLSFLFFLFLFL